MVKLLISTKVETMLSTKGIGQQLCLFIIKLRELICKTRKANWETISTALINRLEKIAYPNVSVTGVTDSISSSTISQRSRGSSSASAVTTDIVDSEESSSSCKIPKLSSTDKEDVELLYDRLDRSKMWKLSTGTIVEDKMRNVAMGVEHEHPTHSLILDITDSCWEDVFDDKEQDEIRAFRSVKMPAMSVEVETYLTQLENMPASELRKEVYRGDFAIESDCYWIQKSYQDSFRLLRSGFFPLHSQTEGNIVKRVWSCVDTCFDFSTVKSVGGEKCSKASADAANKDRCLSAVGRQSSGRKMDYLFMGKQTEKIELGCGECALVSGVKTTKELVDAGFKMPKVMRDMANSILFKRSGLMHDLCMVGYYMGGDTMQLYTLDFPAGYVARLDGYGPVEYPNVEDQVCSQLPTVLELVLKGRWLMEATKKKIESYRVAEPIGRLGVVPNHIVQTFVPTIKKSKKRKINNNVHDFMIVAVSQAPSTESNPNFQLPVVGILDYDLDSLSVGDADLVFVLTMLTGSLIKYASRSKMFQLVLKSTSWMIVQCKGFSKTAVMCIKN
ncbi:hypothetical protein MAM1_0789d11243, partial [Mucor ambiguus]